VGIKLRLSFFSIIWLLFSGQAGIYSFTTPPQRFFLHPVNLQKRKRKRKPNKSSGPSEFVEYA